MVVSEVRHCFIVPLIPFIYLRNLNAEGLGLNFHGLKYLQKALGTVLTPDSENSGTGLKGLLESTMAANNTVPS